MIIGISGYAMSGKNTVADIIQKLQPEANWQIKGYAQKLKEIASIVTGILQEKFDDQDFKKTYLPNHWNYYTISLIDNGKLLMQHGRFNTKEEAEVTALMLQARLGTFRMEYIVGMQQMTVRQFIQELGTDAGRDCLHPNIWVNALMADYVPGKFFPNVFAKDHAKMPNWIIADTRFPNEAQAIKDAGGLVIRIERGEPINTHPSEVALDDWAFDYAIDNNGDLEDLTHCVESFIKIELCRKN